MLGAGLFIASFFEGVDPTLIILGAILMAQTILNQGCVSCNSGTCEYFASQQNAEESPESDKLTDD